MHYSYIVLLINFTIPLIKINELKLNTMTRDQCWKLDDGRLEQTEQGHTMCHVQGLSIEYE